MITTTVRNAIGHEPKMQDIVIDMDFEIGQEVYFINYVDETEDFNELFNLIIKTVKILEYDIKITRENNRNIINIMYVGKSLETKEMLRCKQNDVFAKREDVKERLMEIAKGLIEFK